MVVKHPSIEPRDEPYRVDIYKTLELGEFVRTPSVTLLGITVGVVIAAVAQVLGHLWS